MSVTRFPSALLQQIKDRVDAEDVLSRIGIDVSYSGGGEVRCPCPIHRGDGSNFSWDIESQTWTCFSRRCGEDRDVPRDVFLLVMLVNEVPFASSVSTVASWVGVNVGNIKYDKEKEDELKITRWLRRRRSLEGRDVKSLDESIMETLDFSPHPYIINRGFDESTLREFEVGFATSGELAGRVVVPIRDEGGDLVGFSGRLPSDEVGKFKYKNYADFRSGDVLYGLHKAKDYISKGSPLILSEGFFDVLRAWQNGVRNISATMGTSVTDHQVKLIASHTSNVYLAYDGDGAGRDATRRIYERLRNYCDVKILWVPDGKDFGDMNEVEMCLSLIEPLTYLQFTNRIGGEFESKNQ